MTSLIQSEESVQRHLNKCSQTDTLSFDAFDVDFVTQNANSSPKRVRKTSQLPQFRVFEDKILSVNIENPSGQNEPTLSLIGR